MKILCLFLSLLIVFSFIVSCDKVEDTPEATTTGVTTTGVTTTSATTQLSNKYSFVGGKVIADTVADELDKFIMSIDSERWLEGVFKTYAEYNIEYFGEHKYGITVTYDRFINDFINDRCCTLTDNECELLYEILERAKNS